MFEAKRFLRDQFGSAQQVQAAIRAAGLEQPNENAVVKWGSRNSIPGEWLAVLLYTKEREAGRPISLAPYLEGVL